MGDNENEKSSTNSQSTNINAALSDRAVKWVSGLGGGVVSAVVTILFIVTPVVNTWLANTKEVSLAQIKVSTEQIQYVTQRMADSDKERDLYKQEMLRAQKELRDLQNTPCPKRM